VLFFSGRSGCSFCLLAIAFIGLTARSGDVAGNRDVCCVIHERRKKATKKYGLRDEDNRSSPKGSASLTLTTLFALLKAGAPHQQPAV
jgi:hypothetical protein